MVTDDAFDTITLMAVLMIFAPITIFLAIPFFSGNVGGFDTQIEKTAAYTESEIIPQKRELTTDDILLSLVVADRYTPEPKTLRINTQVGLTDINLNEMFLAEKIPFLIQADAAMPSKVNMDLTLFVGPTGERFWQAREVQ